MLFKNLLTISFTVVLPELSVAYPQVIRFNDTRSVFRNSNYIFNAIHSSMRQWGSSLNHNGMSFFPAYISAGTELYHGTGTRDPVQGMEWLAFEPEHALNFAWKFTAGPPPVDDSGDQHEISIKWLLDSDLTRTLMQQTFEAKQDDFYQQFRDSLQHPLQHSEPQSFPGTRSPYGKPIRLRPGWLHNYVMKKHLRLVYVDGQSAAKSLKGTLDSQDFVLGHEVQPGDPRYDRLRALRMCRIASQEWNGRIDGFIRMEHGFELILCNFETNADLIRVERVNRTLAIDENVNAMSVFMFMRAIAARYHGIGMSRVLLDYSRMVTAFAYDIELFSDQSGVPRLNNVSREDRATISADLSKTVMDNDYPPSPHGTDWQAVADMIIARYSDVLHELAYSPFYKSKRCIDVEINMLMRPFVDYDQRNASLEIQRCASHFIPSNYTPSIASAAIINISDRICSTFFEAAELLSVEDAKRSFQTLVEYLGWTSWKECRGCRYGEVCMTAIWPFGNKEDHTHPSCKNRTELMRRWDYWRDERPPTGP